MQYRRFGNTGVDVSVLGFGCGAVGGLMVRGEHRDMLRTVEFALESGINYFDTARMYGDGLSEIHTGAVLRELGADEALVGTKVRLSASEFDNIEAVIETQIENSLQRMGRDNVDIVYTHNSIGSASDPEAGRLSLDDLERIVSVFDRAVKSGKIRFWRFNGLGDTEAILAAIDRFGPAGMHTCYNMLNPSSNHRMSGGFPYQDYDLLLHKTAEKGIGSVAIRVLAGGALTGDPARHPLATQEVAPIATGKTFGEDLARTAKFDFLVEDGYADNVAEAAIRFAISAESVLEA